MTLAKTALQTAALLLAAVPVAAVAAQPAPSVRAPVPAPVIAPAPPAWTVTSDEARGVVRISAAAKGGAAQFAGGCNRSSSDPGIAGAFSGYHGDGLRTDGQIEHVAFYVRGADWQDAFSVRLRYAAASHSWQFDRPLAPVFLSSFSRGATLAVVNSRNQEIFAFDLTGSTAATRVLRTVCGLE
jgi:hypothetical protein